MLKDKGWANSLSAGGGLSTPGSATFSVSATLTEDGLANIEGVVGHVFEQLRQIRNDGIEQWSFEEQKKLDELDFRFVEKSEPSRYVLELVSATITSPGSGGPISLGSARSKVSALSVRAVLGRCRFIGAAS